MAAWALDNSFLSPDESAPIFTIRLDITDILLPPYSPNFSLKYCSSSSRDDESVSLNLNGLASLSTDIFCFKDLPKRFIRLDTK